jgi:type VI secretion system protein ImpF
LDEYPLVSHSVLNYGIHDLVGTTLSSAEVPEIQQQIRQVIWDFEPRILPESVVVKVTVSDSHMSQNALAFDIEGDLWAQPLPLRMYLRTELDLETGSMNIIDRG